MSASVSNGMNGHHGSNVPSGHGRKGERVLPHINDIQESMPDIESTASMRAMLDKADSLLMEAKSAREFNRPEQAFRAYLHASIIVIKLATTHRDFAQIQTDGSGLHRRHSALLLRISQQHDDFAAIKQDIITNNRLHGTQPKVQRDYPRHPQPPSPSRNLVHGKKQKPPVAPKPRELQSPRSDTSEDLAARFSKLGGPFSSPGQDPRIRTHPPIVPPRSNGLDSGFTQGNGLPKPPAAIYMSPRGTVSDEAAALPTSTPGGLFSRTPSFPAGVRNHPSGSDYFTALRATSVTQKKPITIPEGDKISVTDLQQLVKAGAQVLFIDVRERNEYEAGHFNAQFIICIEPSILHGEDTIANSLRERMAINPDAELELFDRRDTFDMVVIYDEDATDLPQYATAQDKKSPLIFLKRVLYFFSHEQKTNPKLLEGGLDSWLDVFGPQCLVTTDSQRQQRGKQKAPVKYVPQNMSPAALRALQAELHSDVNFIRSTGEFITRFPAISSEPQSMTGQNQSSTTRHAPATNIRAPALPGVEDIPTAPTRPAPTVAKPSVTGLKPGEDTVAPGGPRGGSTKVQKQMTGLYNPGNWCFANSSVQSLRMSPGFGPELSSKEWELTWQIPKLPNEKGAHPRIMARIVANLFHWLNSGNFKEMKAQTLMEYSGALTKHLGPSNTFSGDRQQDAQEFISWLFDALTQETNVNRASSTQPPDGSFDLNGLSVLQRAVAWWDLHLKSSFSIIDKYWRFFAINSTQCDVCKNTTYRAEPAEMLIARPEGVKSDTLVGALVEENSETISGFQCDKCAKRQPATRERRLGRMPDLLCLHIAAFAMNAKSKKRLQWDLDNMDLGQLFIGPNDRQLAPGQSVDKHFVGPFNYECYAIIMHSGPSIHSGHYFTYVRDPSLQNPHKWYEFNDHRVTEVGDIVEVVFKSKSERIPYIAFFRRRTGGLHR
ncbi:ubiquitin carboxyl-terminal hydrolase [Plectosphaerella plurivora]|uniref:Ubiquitin carboxyl-terminal hydrolase n=1 Tax=Plectosphaerella plurivora TaxID=936078 RepID=A0A9P9A6N6_9PEZI|nr:ubiquitin carboxyl-terminal hydrolase [Plectosphaerella plurivora]